MYCTSITASFTEEVDIPRHVISLPISAYIYITYLSMATASVKETAMQVKCILHKVVLVSISMYQNTFESSYVFGSTKCSETFSISST